MAEAKPKAELDQEWGELVEEHRLAMPGVQVLFAFLLILPFQNRRSCARRSRSSC